MTDEEYVRSKWVDVSDTGYAVHIYFGGDKESKFAGMNGRWSAARKFTEERLEAIRLVEEEIALLRGRKWICLENNPAALRILAARQAALDELKRGLKAVTHD
jgi:hypothetical protein